VRILDEKVVARALLGPTAVPTRRKLPMLKRSIADAKMRALALGRDRFEGVAQ
jgi:hypothetical protein